ncbi:MAG: hypothetical protein Kow0059_04230 [Candidatus Sumerlaeia bacterium]
MLGQAGAIAGFGSSLIPFEALAQIPWWEALTSEEPDEKNGLKTSKAFTPEEGIKCEYPAVALDADHNVWMAWMSEDATGERIKLAKFDGTAFSEPRVLSPQEGATHAFQVELAPVDDGLICTWASFEAIGRWSVRAVVRGKDGSEATFRVSEGDGIAWRPAVAAALDGGAWVVWEQKSSRWFEIKARKYKNGQWSAVVNVSSMTDRDNCRPAVAATIGGGVMVAWDRTDGPGNINIVHRLIGPDGTPAGEEIAVTREAGLDIAPAVALDSDQVLWLAWQSNRWEDAPFDVPRWFQLRAWVDGEWREPSSPPPGRTNEERGTEQSFEFVGLYCAGGRVWVTGRASHMFYLQSWGAGGWSPLYRMSPYGWGGRGRRMKLAPASGAASFWAVQRDLQHNTLKKVEAAEADKKGSVTDGLRPVPPPDPARLNLLTPHKRHPMEPWKDLNYYFGDIHGHTWLSDGTNDVDEFYMIRRDFYQMDFASLTDHDTFVGNTLVESEWEQIKEITTHFNDPGRFVTLYGQEWTTARYPRGAGHKCIYHIRPDIPLWDHLDPGADTSQKINALAREWGAIVIPHHIGWTGTDWENFDPAVTPVVEIVSVHGVFEHMGNGPIPHRGGTRGCFVQDGLARGLRFGLIGGNDCHGLIWHHRIAFKRDPFLCGWMGVLAPELTREAIFQAIKKRRCFATTGVRMRVEFEINGAMMGEEVQISEAPRVRVDVTSSPESELKWIEIVRNNETILRYGGEGIRSFFTFTDDDAPAGESWYYLRIQCEDGNMAWSSPIWVNWQKT